VAFQRTRKSGAAGVDGVTAEDYAENLEANLVSLLDRFKSGKYKAPPVRRVHIPKGDGQTRPLGIPTFEDKVKVLQRAVAMVLTAIYEQDFWEFSYGFRPDRSAHQPLAALRVAVTQMRGGWVLDVDIKAFFDTICPSHLRRVLDQRIVDGVVRRAIDKWLNAGVFEDGKQFYPELGTPQGGVISPLLANIYLHEVLDQWFMREIRPNLTGRAEIIRYADDFVIAFEQEHDARHVLEILPERFAKFELTLHPTKTHLVPFQKPDSGPARKSDGAAAAAPGTFDLLGFTHYWAQSRKGYPAVFRKTASKRFAKSASAIDEWCRVNRHLPVKRQHKELSAKLHGHYNYYGVIGNSRSINRFRDQTVLTWKYWLNRRAQHGTLTWKNFSRIKKRYKLPPAVLPKRAPAYEQTQTTRSRMR
jgi:group II intron reverse transcriptase/maturase